MNGSDLYGYIKFMIQSGPHMGCRTSSLGCKEFWPSESRDSKKQICKNITDIFHGHFPIINGKKIREPHHDRVISKLGL